MDNNEGFVNLQPIEYSNYVAPRENLANTFPPTTTDGVFYNLRVGIGSEAFYVTSQGLWLGAQQFADAPFSVAMDGTVTIAGIGADDYLTAGEAAADVNAGATTISGAKITTGSIDTDQLAAGAIEADKIAAGAILSEKIGAGEIKAVNIAAGVIAATHIATGAVTGVKLGDGSVSEVKIANAAVTGAKIADSTITGGKIANATITGAKIAGGTITGSNIQSGTIVDSDIADGTITGTKISGATITGAKIANSTITDTNIDNMSANKLTAGSIYVGYSNRPAEIVINRNGDDGFLIWTGGNKIWSDGSEYMGFKADGGRFYFYTGVSLYALFQTGNKASFYTGISCGGDLVVTDEADIQGSYLRVRGYTLQYGAIYFGDSTSNSRIYEISSNTVGWYGHITLPATATYNNGSATYYWNYMNAVGFTSHSMTSFDSPVRMPNGKEVDDIEALKLIKERKDTIHKANGRVLLDKRTFPEDVIIKAFDIETGKEYKRDENNDPLIPNEKGELEARPDADGVDLVQFTSLLFGAFKLLEKRVEELETESNKNVKI
jgi:uncharacterized protein YjbI with pentapeptide repeats